MVEVAHWEKSRVRWDGRGMRRADGRGAAWEGGGFGAGGGTRKVTGIPRVEVRSVRTRGANELDEGLVGGVEETEAAGGGGEGGKEPADGWELAAGAGKVA
jgi:hypothetical protein